MELPLVVVFVQHNAALVLPQQQILVCKILNIFIFFPSLKNIKL